MIIHNNSSSWAKWFSFNHKFSSNENLCLKVCLHQLVRYLCLRVHNSFYTARNPLCNYVRRARIRKQNWKVGCTFKKIIRFHTKSTYFSEITLRHAEDINHQWSFRKIIDLHLIYLKDESCFDVYPTKLELRSTSFGEDDLLCFVNKMTSWTTKSFEETTIESNNTWLI